MRDRKANGPKKQRTKSVTPSGPALDMVMEVDNDFYSAERSGSAAPVSRQEHPELAAYFVPVHPSHRGTLYKRKAKKKKKKRRKVPEEPVGFYAHEDEDDQVSLNDEDSGEEWVGGVGAAGTRSARDGSHRRPGRDSSG